MRLGGEHISVTRPTEKACTAAARTIKADYLAGRRAVYNEDGDITLYDAFTRYTEAKSGVLAPSTVAGYYRVRDHRFQGIMQTPIHKLTQELVQKEVSSMSKSGLSPKTIANAMGLLVPVMEMFAPELRFRVTQPQKRHYERIEPKEEDVAAIAAAVRGKSVELPTLLAMCLGLRMSEVLGLMWTDIDGEYIHIQRAKVDEGEKLTKTYDGDRWLHIPSFIQDLLDAQPHKSKYIVPMSRRTVYENFQKYTKRAGIQHYRFHDLRHLCATVQLLIGADDRAIVKRMGWKDDTMLRKVYGHTSKERMDLVAEVTEGYFAEQIKPASE